MRKQIRVTSSVDGEWWHWSLSEERDGELKVVAASGLEYTHPQDAFTAAVLADAQRSS
jgi:hypothetical protein